LTSERNIEGANDMTTATAATAVIATRGSIKVEPLTCTIGAELSNVNLGAASRDPGLVAEIHKQAGAHAPAQGSGSPADYIPASSV